MWTRAHQQKAMLATSPANRAQPTAGGAVHRGVSATGPPARTTGAQNRAATPTMTTMRSRMLVPLGGLATALGDHRAGTHQVTYQTAKSQ